MFMGLTVWPPLLRSRRRLLSVFQCFSNEKLTKALTDWPLWKLSRTLIIC